MTIIHSASPVRLLLLADVAAEDGQRADADAQREEGLAHSSEDYLAYTMLRQFCRSRGRGNT